MRFYGLARPPTDAGFFETEHHAQVARDIRAAIMGGRLIAVTAIIGSGKTVLSRRLRADLEREGRVIVSRSLSVDKAKSQRLYRGRYFVGTPKPTPLAYRAANGREGSMPRHARPSEFEFPGAASSTRRLPSFR